MRYGRPHPLPPPPPPPPPKKKKKMDNEDVRLLLEGLYHYNVEQTGHDEFPFFFFFIRAVARDFLARRDGPDRGWPTRLDLGRMDRGSAFFGSVREERRRDERSAVALNGRGRGPETRVFQCDAQHI